MWFHSTTKNINKNFEKEEEEEEEDRTSKILEPHLNESKWRRWWSMREREREREREIRMFYYKSVSVRLNERKIIRIGVHTDLVKDKSHGEEIA